jgi:tripartite-type tricarboxylate transporter receptor subunit TctC
MAALCLAVAGVWAQTWPAKTIRVIVPYTPGSATDIVPRTVLAQVSAQIGQPIVVENRPGGGSTIGAIAVAKADPFSAITPLGNVPLVLVISPDKKIKTVQELVALAKSKAGAFNYASGGTGTPPHLTMERFRLASGWQGQHIPFKGAPEALTEVMTGRIDIYFSPITPALPLIRDGRLVALAVGGAKRSSALPDVPTTVEAGYPNSDFDFWIGLFAPAKTSHDIVAKLYEETSKALGSPEVKGKLSTLGVEPMPLTPEQFQAEVARQAPVAIELAKAAGLAPAR